MLIFRTPGTIDMRAFEMFGLSSKDDTQIGRFGTGLKYASAIILRLGGSLTIRTPTAAHHLTTAKMDFRDVEAQRVYCNDTPLAFTTDLGRDWEPWMAFRELYSNTLDEGGSVRFAEAAPAAAPTDSTEIIVDCNPLTAVYFDRDLYFIDAEDKPLAAFGAVEVYSGQSSHFYYRNIAVLKLPEPAQYRYNFIGHVELSEDRTASSPFSLTYDLGRSLAVCENEQILQKALHRQAPLESTLSFSSSWNYSAAFIGAVTKLGAAASGPAAMAAAHVKIKNLDGATVYTDAESAKSNELLMAALLRLRALDVDLDNLKFALTDNLKRDESYVCRADGTIILNSHITDSTDLTLALLAAICDMRGRNWAFRRLVKYADSIIEGAAK